MKSPTAQSPTGGVNAPDPLAMVTAPEPIEDASDAFVCLPSASDIASLDEAFAATGDVYIAAWNACDKLVGRPLRGLRRRVMVDAHVAVHEAIDAEELFRESVTPERRNRARGLGPSVDHVFRFYVDKAIDDHRRLVTPFGSEGPYRPWLHIGFPLPFENLSIEATEDGLDWLRFGTIGPVAFGFTGPIPPHVHTVCFKKTDDLDGYEVVFVGVTIDLADGAIF
jgi:hypothetical protein